jgi:hypothetical protein
VTVAHAWWCCCPTGDGGPASAAQTQGVDAVLIDRAGNIIFPEFYAIRRIDAATGIIERIVGLEGIDSWLPYDGAPADQSPLGMPLDVIFSPSGDLVWCDSGLQLVQQIVRAPPPPSAPGECSVRRLAGSASRQSGCLRPGI